MGPEEWVRQPPIFLLITNWMDVHVKHIKSSKCLFWTPAIPLPQSWGVSFQSSCWDYASIPTCSNFPFPIWGLVLWQASQASAGGSGLSPSVWLLTQLFDDAPWAAQGGQQPVPGFRAACSGHCGLRRVSQSGEDLCLGFSNSAFQGNHLFLKNCNFKKLGS